MLGEGQYYELVSGAPVPDSLAVALIPPIDELPPIDDVPSI